MAHVYELFRADDEAVHSRFELQDTKRELTLDEPQALIDKMWMKIAQTVGDKNEHGLEGFFSKRKIVVGREEDVEQLRPGKTVFERERRKEEKELVESMGTRHSSIGYSAFVFHTHPIDGLTTPSWPDLSYLLYHTHGYISNNQGLTMCILRDYNAGSVSKSEWTKAFAFDRFNEDPNKMKLYFVYKEILISEYERTPRSVEAWKSIRKQWARQTDEWAKTRGKIHGPT